MEGEDVYQTRYGILRLYQPVNQVFTGKKEGGRTIVCNALNEMKQKSMIEGRAEGGNLMIYSLVQDLLLTPEVGSKRLGITVEELKNRMILCGYNFPEK